VFFRTPETRVEEKSSYLDRRKCRATLPDC
jgi:hypothetical protein